MRKPSRRWSLAAATLVIAVAPAFAGAQALARSQAAAPSVGARGPALIETAGRTANTPANRVLTSSTTSSATGLGRRGGLLPAKNLVLESALQVDLTKETVRLPLYPGKANGQTVW